LCCLALVISVAMLPLEAGWALSAAGALALALYLSAPRALRDVRRLALAWGTVFVLMVPLAVAGDFSGALLRGARAMVCVTLALGFAATLAAHQLGDALRALGAPRGLADTVAMLLRQLGEILTAGHQLVLARRLRQATGLNGMLGVVPALLLHSVQRAQQLELAMSLRHHGTAPLARDARLGWRDAPLLGAALVVAAALHQLAAWQQAGGVPVVAWLGTIGDPVAP
jgi:energy-coupling factor transporter transmembrane protein EcfT